MKTTHTALTKKTLYPRVNVTKFKVLTAIGVIGFIGFIAPFVHIPFNQSGVKGIFGFEKMSSFLFAIGFPVLSLCAGVLLLFATSFFGGFLRRGFRLISFSFFFVAAFFLSWTFIPSISDFDARAYYAAMIILSLLFSLIIYYLSKVTFQSLTRSEKLLELIGDLKVDHYYPLAAKAKESGMKDVEAEVHAFNKKVETTLKEIINE
jgi:hypothetical protein